MTFAIGETKRVVAGVSYGPDGIGVTFHVVFARIIRRMLCDASAGSSELAAQLSIAGATGREPVFPNVTETTRCGNDA